MESSETSRFLGNMGTIDRSHGSSRRNKRLQGTQFEICFVIFIPKFKFFIIDFRSFPNGHASRSNVSLEGTLEGQSSGQDKGHWRRKEAGSREIYGNSAGIRDSFKSEESQTTSK